MNPARLLLPAILTLASFSSPAMAQYIRGGVEVKDPAPEPEPKAVTPRRPDLLVVVNFDDVLAPCNFIQTTPLRNAYAGLGVTFSGPGALNGGAILHECGSFGVSGHSSPNFVGFNPIPEAVMQNGGFPVPPERIQFTQDVAAVQLTVGGTPGTATLSAYSESDQLLGSDSIGLTGTMQPLTVTAPGIRYAILDFEGDSYWVFDDLSFDIAPTPTAPTSWGRFKSLYR
jgi:hypothetical protein